MSSSYKPSGYHKLAQLMGRCDEIAIFRKFNDLNMLCLLNLQAELVELQHDFYSICEDDEKIAPNHSKSFKVLLGSQKKPNNFQYRKLKEIKSKLKEYNALLLQVTSLRKLEEPEEHNLKALHEYLSDPKGGNRYLRGLETFTWDQDQDLIAIRPDRPDQDAFSRWLTTYPVLLYHRLVGHKHWIPAGQIVDEESGAVL